MTQFVNRPDKTGDGATDANTTDTGSANVNAVYPGSPSGSLETSDADVSDMNADSSTQNDSGAESGDVVPGVRSG